MKRTCEHCRWWRGTEEPCYRGLPSGTICDGWDWPDLDRLEEMIVDDAFYRSWYVSYMLDYIGKQDRVVFHPDREDGYLGSIGYDLFIALAALTPEDRRECAIKALGVAQ